MDWYLSVLKQYAHFSGRARRREYWMFVLVNMIITAALAVLGMFGSALGIVYLLYLFGTVIPSLAVGVRRLHDTGRSGWMTLIALIPLIGAIVLLVFLCQDSNPGDNKYGPNPKATAPIEAMPAV